ncbi:hypothetical protein M0802_014907 [Mischocyttarus mexicanus]|nr:hypothetical protein M0802_014907 [Mischocyttarus mexicanus]
MLYWKVFIRYVPTTRTASCVSKRTFNPMDYYDEEWSESFPYQLLIGTGVTLMALVILAAISFQCSSTWRWLLGVARHENDEDANGDLSQQNAIRISHSLPDLQSEPITHEYVQEQKDSKKVLRQTTLPIVPMRHQSFQRQLSHRLDLPSIKFSICSLENRSDSSLGLIRPELYKKDLVRQESTESSSTTEMEYAGKLHFALRYDKEIDGLVVKEKVDLGELMLSLCYLPTAGRLTLTVIKARNLKAMDITGSSDPYVKVYLLCRGKRIKKKKTTVKKNTLFPVYNEALVFDVPADNIEEVSLIVKVIDYDRIGSNELMGCTAIGSSFIGIGRDHWLEMLDNPRKPVAQWYPLLEIVAGHIPSVASEPLPMKTKDWKTKLRMLAEFLGRQLGQRPFLSSFNAYRLTDLSTISISNKDSKVKTLCFENLYLRQLWTSKRVFANDSLGEK